jgi:hypothetical protein
VPFSSPSLGGPKIDDIKRELAKEHYSTRQITGKTLRKQLVALIQEAEALNLSAHEAT